MKIIFLSIMLLLLLTACQQSNQSKTMPGVSADTTITAGKPGIQYRVIIFQRRKKSYNDDYDLIMHDFEGQVNQAIAQGWEPVGGVALAGMVGVPTQAMIKKME